MEEEHGQYVILRSTFSSLRIPIKIYHSRHRQENDGTVQQRQAQIFQTQLSSAELAHQEALIQERESEIREIETGIHELHEIFRDLGTIVQEQGDMLGWHFIRNPAFLANYVLLTIDNIENNVSSIAVDASGAAEELTTAHEYQRKAGKRAACLGIVLIVVVVVVLLAVRVALWLLRHYPI